MKKVIFLVKAIDEISLKTFDFEAFNKREILIEFWIYKYFTRISNEKEPALPKIDNIKVRAVFKNQLKKEMAEFSDTIFITVFPLEYKYRFFFVLLKKFNIEYIVLVNRVYSIHKVAGIIEALNTRNGILNLIKSFTTSPLFRVWSKYSFRMQHPLLAVLGTRNNLIAYNFPPPQYGFKFFHSENYETFTRSNPEIKDDKTILFIDQYLPWHHEAEDFNKWKMNAESYYRKIALTLKKIAELKGCKTAIATHPKAVVGRIEPYVNGIPVFYGDTLSQVAKSALVVLHASLSIDYCILSNKPFVFFMCNEIKNSPIEKAILINAHEFGKSILCFEKNMDGLTEEKLKALCEVDSNAYSKYFTTNIKEKNSEKASYWQYIASFVSNYNSNLSLTKRHGL